MRNEQLISSWSWTEFALGEIRTKDAIGQVEELRADGPVGLLTHLPAVDLVVVNLLAPVDYAFWATPIYDDDWGDWSSGRSVLWANPDMKALQRRLSSEIGSVPSELHVLFGALRSFLVGKRSRGVTQGRSLDYLGHRSIAIPSAELPRVQARLGSELAQFGDLAFLKRWETQEDESGRNLIDATLIGLRPEDYGPNAANLKTLCSRLLQTMQEAIAQIERRTFDIHSMSMRAVTGGVVALSLESSMPGVTGMVALDLQKEVLAWRARLIRLLGWPALYPAVKFALSDGHPEKFGICNIEHPFNVMRELTAFAEEMEARFEVLKSAKLD